MKIGFYLDNNVEYKDIDFSVIWCACSMSSCTRKARPVAVTGLGGVSWTGLDFDYSCWIHQRPKKREQRVIKTLNLIQIYCVLRETEEPCSEQVH